jgi:hypothetical protein
MCRTSSTKTPVALITHFARISCCAARFDAFGLHADDVAVFPSSNRAASVIEQNAAVIHRRAREMNRQACIIELPVVIDDAAFETFSLQRGQLLDDVLPREPARRLQPRADPASASYIFNPMP